MDAAAHSATHAATHAINGSAMLRAEPSPSPSPSKPRPTPTISIPLATSASLMMMPPTAPQGAPASTTAASAATRQYPQGLAVATSAVLVLLIGLECMADPVEAREWSFWVVTLVFPSQQVTWIKIVGLALGFCLSTSYFLSSQAQLASAEQMMLHSAATLVSPFNRKHDGKPRTPSGTTTAAWLASRYQSLLRTDHFANASEAQGKDELPQLKIRDECKPNDAPMPLSGCSQFCSVNSLAPMPFESDYFQGQCLFLVRDSSTDDISKTHWGHLFGNKRRTLWVQVQGRFKKTPPPRSTIYLATELPSPDGFQVAFLTKQLVSLLITLVKKFVPTAHVAFGDKTAHPGSSELPHAAFPLFQTVDEFVTTRTDNLSKTPPVLGQELFGETAEAKKARATTPVGFEPPVHLDAVYTFQFHTMYADFAQWKIVNVPGMPEMDLKRFCGQQPIRIAAYTMDTPTSHPAILCNTPHKHQDKTYLFCFSVHHNIVPPSDVVAAVSNTQKEPQFGRTGEGSERCPPSSPQRWRSVSCDQPDPLVRQHIRESDGNTTIPAPDPIPQPRIRASSSVRTMSSLERAEDLQNWKFDLLLWIERVDPTVGNRKVAYLLKIEEKDTKTLQGKTIVALKGVNSSHAHPPKRKHRYVIRTALTVKNALLLLESDDDRTRDANATKFKKLIVESREFLYETISRETVDVARALREIAESSGNVVTELDKAKKAMLYNCLMSESHLPSIRSYQDIGVQLTKAKREQMDIILEKGVYRMLDPRFMRQEWFILTTTELFFFRSFSVKSAKLIPVSFILNVQAIEDVPFFPPTDDRDDGDAHMERGRVAESPRLHVREAATRAASRWFGIQIHLLTEVVTFFVDSESNRTQCVSSLTQLIKLKAGIHTPLGVTAHLPAVTSLDLVSSPICLNHRSHLAPQAFKRDSFQSGLELVEVALSRGLQVYGVLRHEIKVDKLLSFLDAVDELNTLDVSEEFRQSGSAKKNDEVSSQLWLQTDEDRVVFALNLFQVLFIHTWLLFGDVTTHTHWKKFRSLPFYALGGRNFPGRQVRLSLADLEFGALLARAGPGDPVVNAGATGKQGRLTPSLMIPGKREFRTSFALQTNMSTKSARYLMKVYRATTLEAQLNEASAAFLAHEVVIDDVQRIVYLPKICEWNANDYGSESLVPIGSRAFFCLQKLLPLMRTEQHERIQHLLLGAGNECQIKYQRFWTQEKAVAGSAFISGRQPNSEKATSTSQSVAAGGATARDATTSDAGSKIPRTNSAVKFLQSLFE